jgi:hypothetical protein
VLPSENRACRLALDIEILHEGMNVVLPIDLNGQGIVIPQGIMRNLAVFITISWVISFNLRLKLLLLLLDEVHLEVYRQIFIRLQLLISFLTKSFEP